MDLKTYYELVAIRVTWQDSLYPRSTIVLRTNGFENLVQTGGYTCNIARILISGGDLFGA